MQNTKSKTTQNEAEFKINSQVTQSISWYGLKFYKRQNQIYVSQPIKVVSHSCDSAK